MDRHVYVLMSHHYEATTSARGIHHKVPTPVEDEHQFSDILLLTLQNLRDR